MEAVDYDRTRLRPGSFAALNTSDARAATANFNQFMADFC